jgi:Cu(I)/Ag(I) efflux system membrane fusion protein
VAPAARRLEQALHTAAGGVKDAPKITGALHVGAEAAKQLGAESNLDKARIPFGEVSKTLVMLAGADPRLAKGRHVFDCPMTKTYNKWIQSSEQMSNPYMGPKMLACGSGLFPTPGEGRRHHGGSRRAHSRRRSDYPLHARCILRSSRAHRQMPDLRMDLCPSPRRRSRPASSSSIRRSAADRSEDRVVEKRKLDKTIRTVGRITYDETRIVDVTLKFQGFIGQLFADAKGKRVKKGHTLFTVYSPEVYQAQQDLLIASGGGTGPGGSGPLLEAAKRRLQLWDVSSGTSARAREETADALRADRLAGERIHRGKEVFAGSAVEPACGCSGSNLDKIWIEAELYEASCRS